MSKRDARGFGQFKIWNLKADKTFIILHREIKTVTKLTIPMARQVEWADCEVGVLIHYDIQVFHPAGYQFDDVPSAAVFDPTQLDTDQWIQTVKAAGIEYAVLVAKHGSGFSLWPTAAHDYSVKRSPWKNGVGDIVADFVASCWKYDLRPGLYYHTGYNAYCNVDNPVRVRAGDTEA